MIRETHVTVAPHFVRTSPAVFEMYTQVAYEGRLLHVVLTADYVDGMPATIEVCNANTGEETDFGVAESLAEKLREALVDHMEDHSDEFFICDRCEVPDLRDAMVGDSLCECCAGDVYR